MSDIDKEIAELLPCESEDGKRDWCNLPAHCDYCPGASRPAVAAWARKREAHFMDMVEVYAADAGEKGRMAIALESELAALRQRNEVLENQVRGSESCILDMNKAMADLRQRLVEAERERNDYKAELRKSYNAWDLRKSFVYLRTQIRDVLRQHGIPSNPGWTEDDIVRGVEKALRHPAKEGKDG